MSAAARRQAVLAYQALCARYPSLLYRIPDFPYRIISRLEDMLAFSEEHAVLLGLHSETEYTFLLVDLVERIHPSDGVALRFPYQRLVVRRQLEGYVGVVVVAVNRCESLGAIDGIFFVTHSRHATGATHLELVRGFGEPHLSVEQNALKELREEAGLVANRCIVLEPLLIDTGMTDGEVAVVVAYVEQKVDQRPVELREAVGEVVLLAQDDARKAITRGGVQDSLTVAALARYLLQIAP